MLPLVGVPVLLALAANPAAPTVPPSFAVPPDTAWRIVLPPALPGAVVTATVNIPVQARGRGAARFVVRAGRRVRLFSGVEGSYGSGRVPTRIPLTFTLPRDQAAGPLLVASLTMTWDDGTIYAADLLLDVQPVRHLRLVVAGAAAVGPERPLLLHYRVANLGNAPDSVMLRVAPPLGWRTPKAPPAFVLALGDSVTGSVVVNVPATAMASDYSVNVFAAGRGDTSVAYVRVQVARTPPASGWTGVPSIFFVGLPSVRDPSNPQVALASRGTLDPATTLTLYLRNQASGINTPAFYRYAVGPEYYASIDRPSWSLSAGDVYAPLSGIAGVYGFGEGGRLSWGKATFGDLFLARPRELGSGSVPGYIARGEVGLASAIGSFSARATDFQRPLRTGLAAERSRSGTLVYQSSRRGGQQLLLEAGVSQLQPDSGQTRTGPAVDAAYSYRSGRTFLEARYRRVPGVLPGGIGNNEQYLGAGVPLVGRVQAFGWASSSSYPVLGSTRSSARHASAGLQASGARLTAQLRARYVETHSGSLVLGGDWQERAANINLSVSDGILGLQASADVGEIVLAGVRRPERMLEGRAMLRGQAGMAWAGGGYTLGRFGEMPLHLDAGGSLTMRGLELQGGGSTFLSRVQGVYLGQLWAVAELPIVDGARLVAGTDYAPWLSEGQRIRYSVGIKTVFGLPLPVPARAAARGIVFDDRDANGLPEPGEPPIPGVGLRLGPVATSTDARGRFYFPNQTGPRPGLQVDLGSLPLGWMVGSYPPAERRVNVPLVRAASLKVTLITEADTAGGGVAQPVRDLLIEIVDWEDRQRSASTDSSGAALFRALPPGHYTLTVYPTGGRGQALPIKVIPLDLKYGASRTVVIPVPSPRVEIRFKSAPAVELPKVLPPKPLGPPILKTHR